jgi:pimeloyl-ACP methyl ester carboxylesterase
MIDCLHFPAPNGAARLLLVMLPGAGINAPDFAAHGMIAAVHAQNPDVDITVAQPDMGLYLEDGVTQILHNAVVAPALARGVERIWLLGISLGGMGALLYVSAHPRNIEGVFLLAPFIGTRGTTAEILAAGGLTAWRADNSVATAPERRLLLWLQNHLTQAAPAIYLGYALQDRFAPAHAMLAAALPPARVVSTPGGHDWPAWHGLWQRLLALSPFTGAPHAG